MNNSFHQEDLKRIIRANEDFEAKRKVRELKIAKQKQYNIESLNQNDSFKMPKNFESIIHNSHSVDSLSKNLKYNKTLLPSISISKPSEFHSKPTLYKAKFQQEKKTPLRLNEQNFGICNENFMKTEEKHSVYQKTEKKEKKYQDFFQNRLENNQKKKEMYVNVYKNSHDKQEKIDSSEIIKRSQIDLKTKLKDPENSRRFTKKYESLDKEDDKRQFEKKRDYSEAVKNQKFKRLPSSSFSMIEKMIKSDFLEEEKKSELFSLEQKEILQDKLLKLSVYNLPKVRSEKKFDQESKVSILRQSIGFDADTSFHIPISNTFENIDAFEMRHTRGKGIALVNAGNIISRIN